MSQSGISDLFRRYHRDLVRFTTRLVGDRNVAEEVAQDTYLKLVGGRVQVASIASPKAYLFAAARNIAIDTRTRLRREWSSRVDVPELPAIADTQFDPSVIHLHRRRLQMFADALNELPKACRTAFFLNRVEGLRHRAIAGQLGISVSMVEKHIVRAFLHCRDRLIEADDLQARH